MFRFSAGTLDFFSPKCLNWLLGPTQPFQGLLGSFSPDIKQPSHEAVCFTSVQFQGQYGAAFYLHSSVCLPCVQSDFCTTYLVFIAIAFLNCPDAYFDVMLLQLTCHLIYLPVTQTTQSYSNDCQVTEPLSCNYRQ